MTEEVLEYNKRCAEFLEYKSEELVVNTSLYEDNKPTRKIVFEIGVKKYSINKLTFHSDWNWIMEVVKKINNSIITAPWNGIPDSFLHYINARRPIFKALISGDKQSVSQAINQFLIWYKENN